MKAIVVDENHPEQILTLREQPDLSPGPQDLLVTVQAAGVNRADLLQRKGLYPAPAGESNILGLEIAGDVAAVGSAVQDFQVGDRVFGLVGGGGYAEQCLLDARLAHRLPDDADYRWGAALTEVAYTANENLFHHGRLQAGETVLIHAGASGVGAMAIRMAHAHGCKVFTTTSTAAKQDFCRRLGADHVIAYRETSFRKVISDAGGADVVLDFIGAAYLGDNLKSLKRGGRLVVVGLLGGRKTELDLGLVLSRQLTVTGSVLRALPLAAKQAVRQRFLNAWADALQQGRINPDIHAVFPMDEAEAAHRCMQANENLGKLVLVRESGGC